MSPCCSTRHVSLRRFTIPFIGKLLFRGSSDVETLTNVINKEIPSPSTINPSVTSSLDWVCLRALSRDPDQRWSSAAEMEETLRETALSSNLLASRKEVGEWVRNLYRRELDERHSAIQSSALVRPSGANLTDTRSIAHTCAITTDGALWCWGADDHGQLGDGQILASDMQLVTVPKRIAFPCP